MNDEPDLSPELKSLAAELDALAASDAPTPLGADAPAALPDLRGTDFEIVSELGRGGMGIVYAARQLSLDRVVALKVLAPHLSRNESFRAQFADEARLVAQLHHPNILDVYAAGVCGEHCYFAMERVDGTTARDHAFDGLADVATFGVCVAEALAYAHACGVLHRDVKPANVLIGADGVVKVADFGLACLAGGTTDASGTQGFIAPEILRGESASVASDVYALGRTLAVEAEPFLQRRADADFVAILAKATAEDAGARYADMTAFADDLRRHLAHEPIAARPPSPVRRLALVAALTATDEDRTAPDKRLAKLRRAKETVESLRARVPGNEEMTNAIRRLTQAIEFSSRRGNARPPHAQRRAPSEDFRR